MHVDIEDKIIIATIAHVSGQAAPAVIP